MEFADWCLFLMTPCRICFLLALLLNTIQRTNCNFGLANKSLPECRELVKSRQDVTFPTASVPREKTLMVASADLTTNDFHSWCLDADEHLDIVVSNCNTSSLSQKWFRLGGQLMNLKHGRCIAATGNESGITALIARFYFVCPFMCCVYYIESVHVALIFTYGCPLTFEWPWRFRRFMLVMVVSVL